MEKGEEFLRQVWQGKSRGNTALLAHYQAQHQIAEIQTHYGFQGSAMVIANACAGGGNALGHGADLIRSGMTEVVLAGGYDALCELVYCGFDSLQSLSPDVCRPFDRARNGLMLGEGAGFLVLESEEHAKRRAAPIHALVTGYGHTTDGGHLTLPDQEGVPLEQAMSQALSTAGLSARDIGYVNAHGTGTPFNDGAEGKAFERVFGHQVTRLSSTKAALGHTLGGAGAIEAIISLLALQSGSLPPQINLKDPEATVADSLVGAHESAILHAVMSVNLGFGGSNAALILSRP
jgi:3-oxoacyl-[acyl-carrier-protein] synthase II